MSFYTIQLDRPHATKPAVEWDVRVWDEVAGCPHSGELNGHCLVVPDLETWVPDTLRLVLFELSAYLPAHDPADAMVVVDAKCERRRGGRPAKQPRPPRFDNAVTLSVRARGWRAFVETWTNRVTEKRGDVVFGVSPGRFSEPMQAFLLELAAQSPLPLASLRPEYSAPGVERNQKPSRLNVQQGREAPYDEQAKQWRDDIADTIGLTQEILRRLREEGGAR